MISYSKYLNRSILWIARGWGGIILAFVLFFLIAHIFGNEEGGTGFSDTRDIITFILFPVSTIIGLAIAYKWEGLGGLISSLAILIAMFINEVIDFKFLLTIFPPGFLYLVYWFMERREHRHSERMKLH
ncbi:hypothetical protein NE848_17140 [Gramella jeungdoensis]|uniref:DUF7670 domain-containing protein n=1 Tax=Gramella jeungdoensis TaxID=708091 RepID=A0ABT0Z8N5_9FLAO|nr:hypothetical protein [Gramella jeungdoensis]MCM8571124.1 hypothetical protein [Gramella jeungdoensis]